MKIELEEKELEIIINCLNLSNPSELKTNVITIANIIAKIDMQFAEAKKVEENKENNN